MAKIKGSSKDPRTLINKINDIFPPTYNLYHNAYYEILQLKIAILTKSKPFNTFSCVTFQVYEWAVAKADVVDFIRKSALFWF